MLLHGTTSKSFRNFFFYKISTQNINVDMRSNIFLRLTFFKNSAPAFFLSKIRHCLLALLNPVDEIPPDQRNQLNSIDLNFNGHILT